MVLAHTRNLMKPRRVRWICLLGVQVAVEGEEWIFLAIDKYDCPPQGFRPEGEIPRRHCSNSHVYYRTVLTVEIYSQYTRKNLNLVEQGPRGIDK